MSAAREAQTARKPEISKSTYLIEDETDYNPKIHMSERRNTTRYQEYPKMNF